jgi:ABC-type Fe3+-siderophore transport system permease subunit
MRKLIDSIVFKFMKFKIWLHQKKNGTTWDKFQYSIFWMVILILTSILLGKII